MVSRSVHAEVGTSKGCHNHSLKHPLACGNPRPSVLVMTWFWQLIGHVRRIPPGLGDGRHLQLGFYQQTTMPLSSRSHLQRLLMRLLIPSAEKCVVEPAPRISSYVLHCQTSIWPGARTINCQSVSLAEETVNREMESACRPSVLG